VVRVGGTAALLHVCFVWHCSDRDRLWCDRALIDALRSDLMLKTNGDLLANVGNLVQVCVCMCAHQCNRIPSLSAQSS
jgi:hypothetical protein